MTRTITDDELRASGVSEIDIDRLNRNPATQKPDGKDARDREAVEAALALEQLRRGNDAAKRAAETRGYDLHPKLKTVG